MEDSILTSLVLPGALFCIMLGMGLSLVPDDFVRIARYPKAVAVGLVNQLLILPLLAWGLVHLFGLSPALAVGLMILAACPGGVTSNLITHVAKGDTALSITLTAISSFITVFTIPLIVTLALRTFSGSAQPIELPVFKTIAQVFGVTVLPVSIGMLIRGQRPGFAQRMERPARIGSAVIFVVILAGIVLANLDLLRTHFLALSGVTLSLNLLTMALGLGTAWLLRLRLPQMLSISIESGIQNGTLAIVIATGILKQGDMALPAGVYSLIMFVTGGLVMWYFGRRPTAGLAEA